MAMTDKEKRDTASSKWGTLEELLLVCAISRYGTERWNSVALAVQQRAEESSIGNKFSKAFTPHDCEKRYLALDSRFDADGENYVHGERDPHEKLKAMIGELKRLRVAELRREVERQDVLIKSLQSKVKRLQEERGRSSLKAEEEADLETGVENRGKEEEDGSTAADKPISGKPTDELEDRSLKESNSTSHKALPAWRKNSNRIEKPKLSEKAEPDPVRSALDSKPVPVLVEKPVELRSLTPDETMQSSDVQSTANFSVTKRRGWRRSNEMEVEKSSPANSKVNVKPQPLIKFLEIVRSHKHGFVFQRRLPSQKTQKYKNLIRQHMDIERIEWKLERGVYFESHSTFYRDLLLVFTNALLFFCKSSTEHQAARELRKLVINEIAAHKPSPISNLGTETNDIVVCRRRRNNNKTWSSVKTEEAESSQGGLEAESSQGGLKAEPSTGKDVPMKVKRGRTMSSKSARDDDASSSVLSYKRRKEGAAEFVKRINREPTASLKEEESRKKIKTEEETPLKGRVSGRRSISTTPKKNPKR